MIAWLLVLGCTGEDLAVNQAIMAGPRGTRA